MALKKLKPTSPGQRQRVTLDYRAILTKKEPHKPLTVSLKKHSGRNSQGRISVRHQGGGPKQLYRLVDFQMKKFDIPGRVETIEYDPVRSAFISLVLFKDGERKYILAWDNAKVGDEIIFSESALQRPGNRLPLEKINPGTLVHNIELLPGGGAKIARSAGAWAQVQGIEGNWVILKMPSGEIRKINKQAWASIGAVSNPESRNIVIGKAGRSRHLGVRPTVRGTAMNPVDHPHGGGEGKQPRGTRRPKTLWGKVTGGHLTRKKNKPSSTFILQKRPKR